MRRLLVLAIALMVLIAGCISRHEESSCTPTNDIIQALKCYIPEEIYLLREEASKIPGDNLEWKVWNILKWEDENLNYDETKESDIILKPSEFLMKRKGICTDYAVLTAGLLLASNITPVYLMIFHFAENPTLHAAIALNISGKLFILDQKLPPKRVDSYWFELAKKEGKIITFIEVYKVELGNVSKLKILIPTDFRLNKTDIDPEKFNKMLIYEFRRRTGLLPRRELEIMLPTGFTERKIMVFEFEDFRILYDSVFMQQYVSFIVEYMLRRVNGYKVFWISTSLKGDNLVVKLFLAK
ncbi:hypothetical protein PNA2_1285 [Pyrococcus sp. NA2]|uniref:transglutaminase-like domain-containing protein n=1 Tax=Pyrococcus sp. (strain NA2) TaxID=342949 RepID=UPI000209AD55|nr:transglutaminase-like domain-containing protein [Pyrococcus sp. NA2]AEC52200.1 hypothetical protein PNA2_1285 [Pyrococcus sp. NA2]